MHEKKTLWERKQDQLFLTGQQHKTYVYAMTLNTPKELSLVVAKGRTGRFEGQPLTRQKLDYVDVRSTPTAIKIYGNGFGLKPFDELPVRWKAFFFGEEDCRKANEIIKGIFHAKSIAWGNSDSKYKMFIGAFQQIEQFLR